MSKVTSKIAVPLPLGATLPSKEVWSIVKPILAEKLAEKLKSMLEPYSMMKLWAAAIEADKNVNAVDPITESPAATVPDAKPASLTPASKVISATPDDEVDSGDEYNS